MRRRMTRKGSKRLFARNSIPRKKNFKPIPMRGGFRI